METLIAAIDSGDYRQALRLANQQLLRAQKHLHADPSAQIQQQMLMKSIKVVILVRQREGSIIRFSLPIDLSLDSFL
ncbi:hypothetical protein ACSSS7_002722 [Eimeria intestinalis]